MDEFTSFDGTRIAYHDWPGSSSAPPVILLHGFIATATLNWVGTGVVDSLLASGRRVLAPDARGHGTSDKPHDPSRYGERAMIRDVQALIDRAGAESVDLVGYSMGGLVALHVAAGEPRVRRLVVGGIGAGVVEVGGLDRRVIPPDELVAAMLAEQPLDPGTPIRAFRAFADLVGSDRMALAALIQGASPTGVALAAITAPTLVIAGVDDPLAVRPQVLVDAIAGARLAVLPGDHLTVLADPGFVPAVVDFVTGG
jgi:pimeloyl-ACP methyl ester carboxylesterase